MKLVGLGWFGYTWRFGGMGRLRESGWIAGFSVFRVEFPFEWGRGGCFSERREAFVFFFFFF